MVGKVQSPAMEFAEMIRVGMEAKGLSRQQLADMTGYSLNGVADILIGKVTRPGTERWKRLADTLELDHDTVLAAIRRSTAAAGKTRMPRTEEDIIGRRRGAHPVFTENRIPVMGQAAGGSDGEYYFNGTIVDYVPCPPGLENVPDAYAVYVDGESMSPRYEPRDTVWVHPGLSPRPGDDVVVQVDKGQTTRGYIKRFVGWSDKTLKLKQFNPGKALTFDRKSVVSVHPVVFIRPA